MRYEIIETELAFHNVTTDVRYEDLVKVFPKLKDFSKNIQRDKIRLYFKNAKDALEAFHSGKDVLIGNWKVNAIFNRPSKTERFSDIFGHDQRSRFKGQLIPE